VANQNFKVKKGLEVGTGTTVSVDGINVTGVITATTFAGDGSALTGVTASGTGVVVQEEGSNIGTAATINFIGSNVTAALSGGIANVTVSGGSGGLSNVVEDTTPQLGGNLDLNSKNITGTGNISITGGFNATGVSTFQENVNFTSTASFGDNDKINVGTGNDLQIYHNGTNSFIDNTTGSLSVRGASGNHIRLQALSGEESIVAAANGSVDLYYDNSKKFETTNTGVSVTGAIGVSSHLDMPDSARIKLGTGDDLEIYHSGTNSFIVDSGTGGLYVRASTGYIQDQGNANQTWLQFNSGAGVEAHFAGNKKFETTGVGVTVFGTTQTQQLNVSGVSTFSGKTRILDNVEFHVGTNGASGDYKFYRDSSNTYNILYEDISGAEARFISNIGGISNAAFHFFKGSNALARFSVNSAQLHSGGAVKFETTGSGVNVIGVATATSFSGSGSALTGLTAASAGTYGASTNTPIITVDSNGRITGIATVATSGAGGGGGISNIVEDTTPQLGGNLDLNSKSITGTGNIEITGYAGVSGVSTFSGAVGFATHIHDAGTGNLDIRSNLLRIKNDAGSETLATFAEDGAVSLYHDNALRLATTNTGVSITDNLNVAGISTIPSISGLTTFAESAMVKGNIYLNGPSNQSDLYIGSSNQVKLDHNGSSAMWSNTVGYNYIRTAGGIVVQKEGGGYDNIIRGIVDGAVELYYDNSKKLETTNTGVTVTGTLAATAVTGDGSGLTGVPGISTASSNIQVNFDVTANGSGAYRFTGPGNDAADDNPDLYLIRGQRYRFTNNSGGSHPFQIRSAAGGSAYNTGVTNNGGASGNIDFNVQHDAPSRLYYQCTSHSAMVGNIYITGGANWQTTSVNTSTAEEIFTLNNVGIGTNNPNNNLDIAVDSNNEGIRISSSTNVFGKIDFHANRSGADAALGILDFNWNGTQVARIIGGTGTDTTNKDDGALQFHTASAGTATERLRINSAGKIGINNSNPLYAMHFKNAMSSSPSFIHMEVTGSNAVGGGGGIAFDTSASNALSNNGLYLATISGVRNSADNGSNDLVFKTSKSGVAGDDGNTHSPKERFRITSDGNLGVGNDGSFPIYTGTNDRTLILGTGSEDSAIQIHSGTSNYGGLYFGDATSGSNRYSGYVEFKHGTSDDFLRFGTAATERLRIDSVGSAQFTGADSPSGRNTRISRYGSLLVATTGEILSNARCSIDSGNGNIASAGTGTFAGAVESTSFFKVTNTGIAYLQPNTVTAFQAYESSGPVKISLNNNGSATFVGSITAASVNLQSSATSSWFQTGTSLASTDYVWAAKNSSSNVWHSGLQTDGDLYLGGNLAGTNNIALNGSNGSGWFSGGLGIGGYAAANTIDEYEEGSFTATCSNSITLHSNTDLCQYIKIGTLVTVMGQIRVNSSNGGAGLIISNLPFVAYNAGESAGFSAGSVRLYDAVFGTGHKYMICIIDAGSNNLIFQGVRDNAAAQTLGATSDAYYMFNITYRTS